MNLSLYRGIFIGFLITAIVILFGLVGHYKSKMEEAMAGRDAAIADYHNVTKKYINAQGDVVSISKAFELSRAEFKKAIESNDLNWVKKFTNYKRAQSAQSFEVSFEPDIKHDTVKIPCKGDSIKAFKYSFKDRYNDIEATVIDTPKIEIRDKYYVVITKNRPKNWFIKLQWSRWEFNGEVTNLNRLIKVDSVQTIVVK
jgi:hypothetical protein